MTGSPDPWPRLVQGYDGDWIQPKRRGFVVGCCDCGLIHRIDVRVMKGRVQFRPTRDRAATRANRRRGRFPLRRRAIRN